jgi:putative ABC transport system substrate-binding protein
VAALATYLVLVALMSAADAQKPSSPRRIGVLLVGFSLDGREAQEFRERLRELGYAEARDVVIEWRSANGDNNRIPELVADLVRQRMDVIVVESTPATLAAKRATSAIPVVMTTVADPVGSGLVANLARPGGNVTGFSLMTAELSTKRLQLLKETIPRLARVAVLWNPETPYHPRVIQDLKAAAPSLALELSFADASTFAQLDRAFARIQRANAQAVYVIEDGVFLGNTATINRLALKARLPAMFAQRRVVVDGGLMSYGPSFADLFRRSAGYVDKILNGTKPGDLPVEQPTKFELAINLKTARALAPCVRVVVASVEPNRRGETEDRRWSIPRW